MVVKFGKQGKKAKGHKEKDEEEHDGDKLAHRIWDLKDDDLQELLGIPRPSLSLFISSYEDHISTKRGPHFVLSPKAEMIFIFFFLRHHLVDILLASIFNVSPSTALSICHRMIDFLYQLLSPQLQFTPYDQRIKEGKHLFHQVFYTWVVDGTEQPICSSFHPGINTLLYSSKKNQHSITLLLFVTMFGRIFYLSSSYGGGKNDLDIAVLEVDKWNRFELDEHGMGDTGFRGLSEHGVRIDTPPEEPGSAIYRAFASHRIIVENVIAKIKDFRAAKDEIRGPVRDLPYVLRQHQKIWTILAVIVNDYK